MHTVAIFYGGKSCEHEISVLTGLFVCRILEEAYTVIPVYVGLDNALYYAEDAQSVSDYKSLSVEKRKELVLIGNTLYFKGRLFRKYKKIDCAFNCCHGGLGEGGGLAALVAWNNVPLASPDFVLSGVFQDKYLTKLVVKSLGIHVAEGMKIAEETYQKRKGLAVKWLERSLGYPMIVKPNHLGSSIGIAVVHNMEELNTALLAAFTYDSSALIEKYLPEKRDINCAAYGTDSIVLSRLEEANSEEAFLTYDEKYLVKRNATLPAELDEKLAEQIRTATKKIYKNLAFSGIVRIDYIISGEKLYFNELNVVPGSLAYYLFSDKLTDAKKLFQEQIEYALSKNEWKPKEILISDILKRSDLFYAGGCKIR